MVFLAKVWRLRTRPGRPPAAPAGALVAAVRYAGPSAGAVAATTAAGMTRSDAEGRFHLDHLDDATYGITVMASAAAVGMGARSWHTR